MQGIRLWANSILKSIYILCFILISIFIFLGIKRTRFAETGNISEEAIASRQKYILPDYRGMHYSAIKSRIYNIIKPNIAAVGSSRVLQIREAFFNMPFYNMGYSVGSIPELKETINRMDKSHKPDLIIMGIDFWWFSKYYTPDPVYNKQNSAIKDMLKYVFKPYYLWCKKDIGIKDFFGSFYTPEIEENRSGTIHDGSFMDIKKINGLDSGFKGYNFKHFGKRVRDGDFPFFFGRELNTDYLDTFVLYAKELQTLAKHTVFVLTPLSNYTYADLKKHEIFYPHLFLLKKALEERGLYVYDYTDPALINSSDCEMLDSFHAGEVTYARLLLDLAKKDPYVKNLVNKEYLADKIKTYDGFAMIPDEDYFNGKEADFLELGCKKKPALQN